MLDGSYPWSALHRGAARHAALRCDPTIVMQHSDEPARVRQRTTSSTYSSRTVQSEISLELRRRRQRMASISEGLIERLPVPCRLSKSNERLSRRSTALSAKPNASSRVYQRKLAALDALKQSLLHQAFSGGLLGRSRVNEAETRAEHIDPALDGGRLGRRRGQPHPARVPDHAGPHRRPRPPRQAAHRRLRPRPPQPQAGRGRGQGVGQAAHRGRRPGQGLRRQDGRALRLRDQRQGHLRRRHGHRRGGRAAVLSLARRALGAHLRRGERLARPLRRRALRGQGRLAPGALLPGHRRRARDGGDRRRASSASCSRWPPAPARPSSPSRSPGSSSTAAGT